MAKKVKEIENESVVVDVENNVTSVSSDVTTSVVNDGNHCGIDAFADGINEKPKQKSSKKVKDLALEHKIAEMEQALENAQSAIESAAADNERLADELGVSAAENKSLRKELSKCKQDYRKCQSDNRANAALVDTLNDELTRQKVQNTELISTIGRLQESNKEKDEKIKSLGIDVAMRDNEISKYKGMSLWERVKFVFVNKV